MPIHILSISYDAALLHTREQLLRQNGYSVESAEGFVNALKCCHDGQFDLAIMGHSIPHEDKKALLEAIRESCAAPVIALLRAGESPLDGAAATADPMNPKAFLEVVQRVLGTNAPNS